MKKKVVTSINIDDFPIEIDGENREWIQMVTLDGV